MGVPARALRLFLRACAVDIRTCIEKRDLVEALLVWGSPDLPILQQVEKDVPNDDDDDENDDDESAKPVKSPTPTPETPTKGPSVPSTDHNTQFVNVSAGHQAYIATIEGCTIKKLKTLLHTRGISTDGCVEKSDLVARVVSHGIRITSPAEEDDGLCTICYERPGNIVLLYCGHIGFCETCATSLSECPYCRKPIARRQRVYRA